MSVPYISDWLKSVTPSIAPPAADPHDHLQNLVKQLKPAAADATAAPVADPHEHLQNLVNAHAGDILVRAAMSGIPVGQTPAEGTSAPVSGPTPDAEFQAASGGPTLQADRAPTWEDVATSMPTEGAAETVRSLRKLPFLSELSNAVRTHELAKAGYPEFQNPWENAQSYAGDALSAGLNLIGGPEAEGAEGAFAHEAEKWGVLTAEKGGLDAATNATRNASLRDDIIKLGYTPQDVLGASKQWGAEKSFYVPDMKPSDAVALGKKYEQDAVITHAGMHMTGGDAAGTVVPHSKLTTNATPETENWTEFPDGRKMEAHFNFDKSIPDPAVERRGVLDQRAESARSSDYTRSTDSERALDKMAKDAKLAQPSKISSAPVEGLTDDPFAGFGRSKNRPGFLRLPQPGDKLDLSLKNRRGGNLGFGPLSYGGGGAEPVIKQSEYASTRADPIVAAAIKTPSGEIHTGITHAHAYDAYGESGGPGTKQLADRAKSTPSYAPMMSEGFVTKSGRYLTRDEAEAELGRRPVAELMNLEAPVGMPPKGLLDSKPRKKK